MPYGLLWLDFKIFVVGFSNAIRLAPVPHTLANIIQLCIAYFDLLFSHHFVLEHHLVSFFWNLCQNHIIM
jgi:hypothetical protein